MSKVAHMVALHGALWSADRWYRFSWYAAPVATALLILGWICIGMPAGATAAAAWGRPLSSNPNPIRTQRVTMPAQTDTMELELVSCLAGRPVSSETACSQVIDSGKIIGQRLAAAYTERAYLRRQTNAALALVDYDNALRVYPGLVDALAGRAWINMTRSDYSAAMPDLDKAIELAPGSSTAHYYRGFAYLRLKNYPKALADLNEAQTLQSTIADVYLARGEVEQGQSNNEAALLDFDAFSKRAPKDPRGLIASGAVLETMGRPHEALTALEAAVTLAPDNDFAVSERDRLRAKQTNGDAAKTDEVAKNDDKQAGSKPK